MKKLAWHFDFHSHRDVRIGHNPDVTNIAEKLSTAQVEEIIIFAKCHTGFSYYPTKIGIAHPKMKGDPFGAILNACKEREIKVLAYVSFGIDGEAGRRYPEWRRLQESGKAIETESEFICICPFTAYAEEYFFPQVKEIIELYNPDGFFFDTMSAFSECYCEICREAFRKETGLEIPFTEKDNSWGEYGKFRHRRAQGVLQKVGDFIHSLDPHAVIGFNQIGSIQYPDAVPETINWLTLDIANYGRQSLQSSLCANFGSTSSLSADIMPTRFNQGWGDWSSASEMMLRRVAVPILAYGVRLYMGDRLHPEVRLTAGSKKALRILSALHAEMTAELPDSDVSRSPDILVLHSPFRVYGGDLERFGRQSRRQLGALEGAQQLLIDSGYNFAVTAEAYVKNWLSPERLLIIPETPKLLPETAKAIEQFVQDGGSLLVTGGIPEVDGKPWTLPGISEDSQPWQDHIYLPPEVDDEPVLVRGEFKKIRIIEARAVSYAIPPYDLEYGMVMGWGINPPETLPSDVPAMTRRDFGKGVVQYLGCPIFQDYANGRNWQQKLWFERLLPDILPGSPRQRLISPGGNVELISYASESCDWSILLNHGGEELSCCRFGEKNWPRTTGVLPEYQLTLVLNDRDNRRPVNVNSGNQSLDWQRQGDEIYVSVNVDRLWKTIKVTWK